MRLIPSQTERQFFGLLLLSSLAFLLPSFWIAAQGSIESIGPTLFVLLSVAFLLTVGSFAGTRRQITLGILAPALFFAIAFWLKPLEIADGDYWYSPNYNGPLSRIFFDQSNRLGKFLGYSAAVYGVVFGIALAGSILFDRMMGTVSRESGPESIEKSQDESDQRPAQFSRLRFMIGLAVLLFVVQLLGRFASLGNGGVRMPSAVSFVNTFAGPMGLVLVLILPAAIACRIRSIFSPLIGLLLIAAGVFSIAMQKGIAPRSIPMSQQMIVVLGVGFGIVFLTTVVLVGKTNRTRTLRPSWLSFAGVGVIVAAAFFGNRFDAATYFFSDSPFDLAKASIVHRLQNSDSVASEISIAGNDFVGRFEFQSGAEPVNFFNENELPQATRANFLSFKGMSKEVDLTSLGGKTIQGLNFEKCQIDLAQMRLLKASYLSVSDCTFTGGVTAAKLIAPTNVNVNKLDSAQFAKLLNAFAATSILGKRIYVYECDLSSDRLMDALQRWLENGGGVYIGHDVTGIRQLSRLPTTMELNNLTIPLKDQFGEGERGGFRLVLTHGITARGNLAANAASIRLLIAAPGEIQFGGNYEAIVSQVFKEAEFREAGLVWDGAAPTDGGLGQGDEEITKLFFPLCREIIFDSVAELTSLESLSLDGAWIKHESTVSKAGLGNTVGETVDVTKLAALTGLKQLYFSAYADVKDLRVLKPLEKLETLQVSTKSKGFSANLFPNLKRLRLHTLTQPSLALLNELSKIKKLQSVTFIDGLGIVSEEQLRADANGVLDPRVELRFFGPKTDQTSLAPDEFKAHRERVRQQFLRQLDADSR